MKLEFFYMGNGATVCDVDTKALKEIAHISNAGNIKFYTPATKIPGAELLKIEHVAHAHEANTKAWLERELTTAYGRSKVLDDIATYCPWRVFDDLMELNRGRDEETKTENIISVYLANF